MLARTGGMDTENPGAFEEYFRRFYAANTLDAHNIQRERQALNFAAVGRDFKLIEDGFSHPVIVPHGDACGLVARLLGEGPSRETLRALQPYLVQIYEKVFKEFERCGVVEEVSPGIHAVAQAFHAQYDAKYGLVTDEVGNADPEVFIV